MKRHSRPRRSLWLALGLVIGALAATAAVALAGLQPADLNYTPNSESQMTAKSGAGAPKAPSTPSICSLTSR